MVFLFLSVLFLILRSYSFLSPGAVVLSLAVIFYRKQGISNKVDGLVLPLSVLTLIFLAIGGLDGSTPGDLLDLLCVHCCGILFLKRDKDDFQKIGLGSETGFLKDETLFQKGFLFLFLLIAGFKVQWDFHFWNKIGFFYLIKSGILTCVLGFLHLRTEKNRFKTFFFVFLVLCILFVQPSQGVLNFSYFHLFSFLQTDIESKKINVGIKV
ncbi:hypothetical protein [Leptospira alstonii]|uniref:Uncharacterized protein n=2 Tax=Leptospira alstonii TaxID=28452 RepID=M6D3X0_9LEPT|nr:hypothetical protein [Leptospira alstonii]EMJ93250.1 hypothetical protein LEP1GSC194_1835 [Leptospira alstonii serovar Sichuan str. 79601]EQA78351.1 hypothetical protein LEP1GSC193_4179 [Leptospira alstonii serovar Pingchang str. 80-412]